MSQNPNLPTSIQIAMPYQTQWKHGLESGRIGFNVCPYESADEAKEWQHGYSVGQQDAKNSGTIAVRVGRKLFEIPDFHNYWAAISWTKHRMDERFAESVCIDSKGRLCSRYEDYQRASNDGGFPVSVYLARPET